jgi:hypothetical protein
MEREFKIKKCVASKGLMGAFFRCVASKRLSGAFFVSVARKEFTGYFRLQRVGEMPKGVQEASNQTQPDVTTGVTYCQAKWIRISTNNSNGKCVP